MIPRIYPPKVYVADTGTIKGRGVFAAKVFKAGELVELCPVVIFNNPTLNIEQIQNIIFSWDGLTGSNKNIAAIALGYGSLYNHNNPSNMRYIVEYPNVLSFYTVLDVNVRNMKSITF